MRSPDRARLLFRDAASAPVPGKRLHDLAVALHRAKRSDEAVVMIRRAILFAPEHPEIVTDFHTMASLAARGKRIGVWTDRVLVLNPAHLPALRLAAADLIEKRAWLLAARAWSRVVLLDPARVHDYVQLGFAVSRCRDVSEGIAVLTWASMVAPDHVGARYSLATALFNGRAFERAELEIRRVLERAPDDRKVWFWLGRVLHAMGRRSEAKAALEKASMGGGEIARWCQLVLATVRADDFESF